MLFNSFAFAIFFITFYPAYLALKNYHQLQNNLVLIASFVFYGWWDWRFLLLLSFTILLDHSVARAIDASADNRRRKKLLLISILSNLSILGVFKYLNFFIDSTLNLMLVVGIDADPILLSIVLPVGISFYTFQSMSYVIDVYRKNLLPTPNPLQYATYVSFFPQLVAGPIERATRLLPQIVHPRQPTLSGFYEGSHLVAWGLFKKLFIADNLAKIVNPVFADPNPSAEQIMVAVYAFSFQIYCDFSAYSDIARGIARMLGIELMINFRFPYLAKNPADFWRRWHISLSTWLRDYLYIPLGGAHGGIKRTCRNLMLTMVLGGIWHGAAANFIFWGVYHGTLLTFHRIFSHWRKSTPSNNQALQTPTKTFFFKIINVLLFFHFTCYGWLLFRAESGEQVILMTQTLIHGFDIASLLTMLSKTVFFVFPLLLIEAYQWHKGNPLAVYYLPIPIRVTIYLGMIFAVLGFGVSGASEFIYFQF